MSITASDPINSDVATNEIVRAGAGAGKTYTLTHKVMAIAERTLREKNRLPRLIVTTFTRKATQELRERLMLLALSEKPELIDFVNSRAQLVVSTIHGIMDIFLKRYGANINVDPGYKVISSREAEKLARQTLRQILLSEQNGTFLESFPFNQLTNLLRQLATTLSESPEAEPIQIEDIKALFLERALQIGERLQDAANDIRSESTNESWLEMADRLNQAAKLLGGLSKTPWEKTRPAFLEIVGTKKAAYNSKKPPVSEETSEEVSAVLEDARDLKDHPYDPEQWLALSRQTSVLRAIGEKFAAAFLQAKREQGLLEIGDLELLAMECLRRFPETATAFCAEWDHWLIDEYQDTSPFQVELLRLLSGPSPNFIVGDPQQSIYLFRGARSEVFGAREKEILRTGGRQHLLTVNRRSQPELLLFLNDFFSTFEIPFRPMEPFLKDGEQIDPAKKVATIFIAHEDASANPASDAPTELNAIANHVLQLVRDGAKPEDICVLARKNDTLTEIATHLNRFMLPTHVHAASGYFDRREVRDALALLKFLSNQHDNFNTLEVVRSPWYRIPDDALAELTITKPRSVWDHLVNQNSSASQLGGVYRLLRLLELTSEEGLSGAFRRALVETGFIDLSHEHDVSGRRESNIWKLLARLESEERRPGFNPIAFVSASLKEVAVEEGSSEGDAIAAVEPNRINLMTVHASKGLEFKHVIVPRLDRMPAPLRSRDFIYLEDRARWSVRFPYGEDGGSTGGLPEMIWRESFSRLEREENARVLYVALTRASETLFLSWTEPIQRNSWAQMIRLDLARGPHATENYSYDVLTEIPQLTGAALTIENEKFPLRKKWLEKPHVQVGALGLLEGAETPQALSVSDMLERKPGVHLESSEKLDVARRLRVAAEGTLVHRLMELLKFPSQTRLGALIKKWFPHQEERVLAAIQFVRESRSPSLMTLIQNGEVEWGFSFIESGILIEGQIDLWGRDEDGTPWIADYKTGSPEYRDKAFEQMSLYALALRRSGLVKDDEKIRLAAIFPFHKKVFIEEEPTLAEVHQRFGF